MAPSRYRTGTVPCTFESLSQNLSEHFSNKQILSLEYVRVNTVPVY